MMSALHWVRKEDINGHFSDKMMDFFSTYLPNVLEAALPRKTMVLGWQ